MRIRKPNKSALSQSGTLWNYSGYESIVNGAKQRKYNRYHIHSAVFDGVSAMLGTRQLGNLYLEMYNGVTEVRNENGEPCRYVSSHEYLNASESEQRNLWTLNPDDDYFNAGIFDDMPSFEGEKRREDFKITYSDAKFDLNGKIHHWEVYGT